MRPIVFLKKMTRTTYIKKICTADIVNNWGAELVPPTGCKYAVCNAKGRIKWDTTRLVSAEQALDKGYTLLS